MLSEGGIAAYRHPAWSADMTLRLDGSEGCAAGDRLWPDGTLVIETQSPSCHPRWWPGVAQLAR